MQTCKKGKSLLALLLALVLVVAMSSVTAFAASGVKVQVGGTTLNEGANGIGGGTATLDITANTLTLENVVVDKFIDIRSDDAFTINIKGNTSLGSEEVPVEGVTLYSMAPELNIQIEQGAILSVYTENGNNIYAKGGSLTISGPGKLVGSSVAGESGAYPNLAAANDVSLTGNLNAELFSEWHGVFSEEGNILVDSSKANIDVGGCGLFSQIYDSEDNDLRNTVTLRDSMVDITFGWGTDSDGSGVFCGGDILVENTVLTTEGDLDYGSYSLYSSYGDITIRGEQTSITAEDYAGIASDDGALSIESGSVTVNSVDGALFGWNGLSITGGTVQATTENGSAILSNKGPMSITGDSTSVVATSSDANVATIRNVRDGGIHLDASVTANNTAGGKPFEGVMKDGSVAITMADGFTIEGVEVYTKDGHSWFIPAGGEEDDPITGLLEACKHVWGEPVWNWSEDHSSATATFVCEKNEAHTQVVNATVTSQTTDATCYENGRTVYRATVAFNDVTYTDEAIVGIPCRGYHTYSQGKCTKCGAVDPMYPQGSGDSDKDDGDKDNPPMGDSSSIALGATLLLLSGVSIALLARRKRTH